MERIKTKQSDVWDDIKPDQPEPLKIRDESGRFIKGNSGKPKGAVNKMTKEIRNKILSFVLNHIDDLEDEYQFLNYDEKISLILQLTKMILPKPKLQDLENDESERRPIILQMRETETTKTITEILPDDVIPDYETNLNKR